MLLSVAISFIEVMDYLAGKYCLKKISPKKLITFVV